MTNLALQKKLAAKILGVGISRVRIDINRVDEVSGSVTRESIKRLIKDEAIIVEHKKGNSRGRWREMHRKRKAGRRRGSGKRKGSVGARADQRSVWINTIRKLRRYLRWLRNHNIIDTKTYRRAYRLAKGGVFKNLSDLKRYLGDLGITGIR